MFIQMNTRNLIYNLLTQMYYPLYNFGTNSFRIRSPAHRVLLFSAGTTVNLNQTNSYQEKGRKTGKERKLNK